MPTFYQMSLCRETTRVAFQAAVMGLKRAFCAEVPTSGGRVLLVRDGDEHGPIVGFRDDYLGVSSWYVRPR